MTLSKRADLRNIVRSRRDAIAERWYKAVVQTSYVSCDAAEIRERIGEWTTQVLDVLLGEPFVPEMAASVGRELADFHYLEPEALGRTQRILACDLVEGLPLEQIADLEPNLASLLAEVAFGFYGEARQIILAEQEQARRALVTELTKMATALKEARDHLEQRVVERTAELAQVNEELRSEIAERKRVEQALRESEERWRLLVENAPDIVLIVNAAGEILFMNRTPPGARYAVEDAIGHSILDHAVVNYREEIRGSIALVFETAGMAHFDAAVYTEDGRKRWYATRAGPIMRDGKVDGVMLITRDVTERRRVEELKENLIRDVSHELRTPLAKLRMGVELLGESLAREEIDRERVTRIGQMVNGNVQRLLRLVEGMLDLSSLEAGRIGYDMGEVDPKELLEDVIVDMQPLASVKGLELVADLPTELPTITGDREKLLRVFTNLIDNAIKFTEEGRITLSASSRQGALKVSVSDPGLGILPENLERVFERFFQEKARFPGVGMGLAICKAITEAHGGRIWAESEGRGLGTTIRLTLPVGEL